MNIFKKISSVGVIFAFLIIYPSCSGKNYREIMKQPEKLFYQGKYKKAANLLKPMADKRDQNQLLYMMEAGYMFHAAGDMKTSNRILLKAGNMAKIKKTSVSKQVSALLTNQRKTNYNGEDFEKVLLHMYSGINFLLLKNYESSRVEFKRVMQEFARINGGNSNAKYKHNIMAKYLTGIAYEISGIEENDSDDLESAYIEYKQIHKLAPRLKMVKKDLIRLAKMLKYNDDLGDWKRKFGLRGNIPKNSGELVVIFEAGKSAIKKSRGKLLADKDIRIQINTTSRGLSAKAGVTIAGIMIALKMAENPIPKFVRRSNKIKMLRIVVNGRAYKTIKLENIEKTAVKTLKDQYGKLKLKVAVSVVTKLAVSIAAGYAAKRAAKKMGGKLGAFSGLIGQAVGAGAGAAMFSAMKPDLRCWHTLPANLQLARIFLPANAYDLKFQFIGSGNQVVLEKDVKINIQKNKKTIFNYRTLF